MEWVTTSVFISTHIFYNIQTQTQIEESLAKEKQVLESLFDVDIKSLLLS